MLGDSVTTDHISPAGAIPKNGPAAQYLREHGVEQPDWNTFGARRGNHEVMMRGTFGNVRIKNALVPDKEGNWTVHFPSGEVVSIYDAAMRYVQAGTPLVVLTGKEYGTGSSRDWAAKGTMLLGVKAVIAESYERIHRSNLVGMGVLPLTYLPGETRGTHGLTGRETFIITGIAKGLAPGGTVQVEARREDGATVAFKAVVRLNSEVEVDYYRHGGILQRVLRKFAARARRRAGGAAGQRRSGARMQNDLPEPGRGRCLTWSSARGASSGHQVPEPLAGFAFAQLQQRAVAQLADPLAGDAHHPADLLERAAVSVVETEVQPQDLGIPRRERGERRLDVAGLAVGHRVASVPSCSASANRSIRSLPSPSRVGMVEPHRLGCSARSASAPPRA